MVLANWRPWVPLWVLALLCAWVLLNFPTGLSYLCSLSLCASYLPFTRVTYMADRQAPLPPGCGRDLPRSAEPHLLPAGHLPTGRLALRQRPAATVGAARVPRWSSASSSGGLVRPGARARRIRSSALLSALGGGGRE